jgi:Family of unknown function (DUF6169)
MYLHDFIGGINNSYIFTSDDGIVFEVRFKPSPYILGAALQNTEILYEFVIEQVLNPTSKSQSFDPKIAATVADIFNTFYSQQPLTVTIFICETADGKEEIRLYKFVKWFAKYNTANEFVQVIDNIYDDSKKPYPVSLIIKKDNPHRVEVVEQFYALVAGYNLDK